MTDNQLQEIVMIRKINGFGQKYNSIIGTFPEIAGLFTALGNSTEMVQANHAIQMGDKGAIGQEKERVKATYMAHLKTLVTRSLGYFNLKKRAAEAAQCQAILSHLPTYQEYELADVADTFTAIVAPALPEMAGLKVTPDRVALLTGQRDTFRNLIESAGSARYESVKSTAAIGALLKESKRMLREELDLLMEVVADENPAVFDEYKALRRVTYRRRKRPSVPETANRAVATATLKVVDATNGQPIEGATLSVDGQPVNDITDEYGEIDLDNLTLAPHTFTAIANGYEAATLKGATTLGGEDYVFELGLEPEGSS